jgi:7-cyano-7-deazaguanine synthase
MKTKALVILSGGQDSTTCLFWAKQNYDEVHAITFDYGQRHSIEIDAARKVAEMASVASHEVVAVPNCLVSSSPLTSNNELEKYENADQMETVIGDRVELTFVPMRNTFFFVVAMNRAVALDCRNLVTGICQEDNANYPDCTELFRNEFENMANISLGISTTANDAFKIHAPLMNMTKGQSVVLATMLKDCMKALAYSHTSYDGKYPPTDMNHANVLRAKGFESVGIPDPLVMRAVREGLMQYPRTDNYSQDTLLRRVGYLL